MRVSDRGEQLNRGGPTAMLCHTGRREFLLQLLTAVCDPGCVKTCTEQKSLESYSTCGRFGESHDT
jgi:hypothetical protein